MGNLPKYDCVSQTDSIFREIVREESAEELCQYGLFEADQMPAAATESMVLYLCIRITGDVLAARMNDISHAQADANKAGVRLTFFFAMMGLRGCRIGLCSGEAAARAAVVAAKPNGSFDETKFSSWYAYEMASTGMLPSVVSANCGSKLRGATLNPLAGIIE